jgi:type II secretory pathway component PulF
MDRGYLLSQAMERFPRVFDTHYISLIKAGEKSGCLVSNGDDRAILDMLLEHLERQTSIKAQVKDNLRYPLIVLGIMLLVLLVMGYVVLPFFKEFLAALIPDPNNIFLPTRIMFFVADFFTDYWYIPLLVIGGLTAAGVTAYQSPQGQRRVHEYQLKVTVFQKLILAELLSLMATLVAAGLNWGEVLKLMQQSATNIEIKEALEQAHTHIYEGIALPEAFRRAHWLFDGLTHSILQVAITTGATEQTLRNHSNKLLNEAVREINAWLTYFQPAMIVTLGVIVGFIVISFYGGMSTLIQGLGK